MKLIKFSDLLNKFELSTDAKDILIHNAEAFLRAGGTITWLDWLEFTEDERVAFIVAGNKLRAETIGLTGLAMQSRDDALRILSQADGGELLVQTLLNRMVNKACNNLNGKELK